jgi:hypothetical protein
VEAIRVARAEVARGDVYTTEEILAAFRERGRRTP